MKAVHTRHRQRERGANLALLACVAGMLIAFTGVAIYLGLQAYLQNELQKAATTAALAGAACYYSGDGPQHRPMARPNQAEKIAKQTFNALRDNSRALKGFGMKLDGPITHNTANDSLTVKAKGSLPTPFLAPVGLNRIDMSAEGTARALKYEPTRFIGPVSILPRENYRPSYYRVVKLRFPMVDGPGTDMYVEQLAQQPYALEACNHKECYDLAQGATKVGSSRKINRGGADLLVGTFTVDLEKAGVNKASYLRITHGNLYANYYAGLGQTLQIYPTPLNIDRIMIFGYAGVCPDRKNCPIPAGLAPVE